MSDRGIGSWTERRARMSPDRVAVVYGDREWTYAHLHRRAVAVARGLAGLGVRRGDRVGYLGPNHPAFLETLFAAGRLGAVFVPLNWRLAVPELAFMLADSGAGVLVVAPEQAEAAARLRDLAGVRTVEVGPEYERMLAGGAAQGAAEPGDKVGPDDTCMILYTSGTTGRPKGALLTHGNVTWNCLNLLIDVDLAADEVTLVVAPMFHVAALNQTVLPTLLKGGRVVLVPHFDPDRALELVARHRVTYLFGVPTMFLAMARAAGWPGADLGSVRSALCGGAPVPAAVIAAWQDRGVSFLQGYGLTEASPGVLLLRRDDSVRRAGSAGTPVFFAEVRLIRPDGAPAGAGEPGEILVRGPTVMSGYWGLPNATAEALSPDGWLRTGDVGVADEDGYVTIRDRIGDLIISGGENIYPAEVEDALYRHPAVAECAVIGVPDEHWGEVGRAIVVRRPGAEVEPAELLAFLASRLGRFKLPKSVVFADSLPRTVAGKLIRGELRARYT
ncbi:long-chain fatty acid--CoA ligase [Plantactinospora siamensis]|uniref:Long-chain fatty acid--CoA ligase n=1 Tax=Plantactinospora siamensis TaxID=555372 RepID=A0ABV6P7X7_9ACTN